VRRGRLFRVSDAGGDVGCLDRRPGLMFAAIALPSVIRPASGALTGPHGRPAVQFRPHL
jgi:hypothetical protein